MATYNIELAAEDTETLRSLAESMNATTELHLNSIKFNYGSLPGLQPTWELLEPHFWVDYLTGMVSISEPDDSGTDRDDTDEYEDIPSLQTISDTNSELDNADENMSVSSDSMPGLQPRTDSTSSDGGGCTISIEDDGILVQGLDWEVLQLLRTRAEGATQYALGNVYEQRAADVLNRYHPYWDGAGMEEGHDFFLVHQISDSTYAVKNTASELEFFVTAKQLQNTDLDLPNAFRQMLQTLHEEGDPDVLEGASEPLGDAMAITLGQRLVEALPWPDCHCGDETVQRFRCFQLVDTVEIQDNYLALSVHMPCTLLLNPHLDFRDWYAHAAPRAHLDRASEATPSDGSEIDNLDWELVSLFEEQEIGQLLNEQWYAQAKPYLELNAAQNRRAKPEPDDLTMQ